MNNIIWIADIALSMSDNLSGNNSLAVSIVKSLADVEGKDPIDLDYTLYDYIDPDALNALMDGTDTDYHLRLQIADHTVTVDNDGFITVDEGKVRNLG